MVLCDSRNSGVLLTLQLASKKLQGLISQNLAGEVASVSGLASVTENAYYRFHNKCVKEIKSLTTPRIPTVELKLLSTVHFSLSGVADVLEDDDESIFNRKSYSKSYWIYETVMEVSIMCEEISDSEFFLYVLLSFPESVTAYRIIEISSTLIPTFKDEVCEMKNDYVKIREICIKVNSVLENCVGFLIKGKKIRSNEFSLLALTDLQVVEKRIEPKAGPAGKKRKAGRRTVSTLDSANFKRPLLRNEIYSDLKRIYDSLESKPDTMSRLFGVINAIFVQRLGLSIAPKDVGWPGGVEYSSKVYNLWVTESLIDESVSNENKRTDFHIFRISVMTNETDYYLSLRYTNNATQRCVKKLLKDLVPRFDDDDQLDILRIRRLTLWISALYEHFILKVIRNEFNSRNPSFVSLVSTPADESDSD